MPAQQRSQGLNAAAAAAASISGGGSARMPHKYMAVPHARQQHVCRAASHVHPGRHVSGLPLLHLAHSLQVLCAQAASAGSLARPVRAVPADARRGLALAHGTLAVVRRCSSRRAGVGIGQGQSGCVPAPCNMIAGTARRGIRARCARWHVQQATKCCPYVSHRAAPAAPV